MSVKFEVPNPNIALVIGRNLTKREQILLLLDEEYLWYCPNY